MYSHFKADYQESRIMIPYYVFLSFMSVWNSSLLAVAKKLHIPHCVHICSLDNFSQGPFPCAEFHHTPSTLATTGLETEKCATPIAVCD